MVQKEVDHGLLIENCFQTAANFTDSIYGNNATINYECLEEEREQVQKERLIFFESTLKFLYQLALEECNNCVKNCHQMLRD